MPNSRGIASHQLGPFRHLEVHLAPSTFVFKNVYKNGCTYFRLHVSLSGLSCYIFHLPKYSYKHTGGKSFLNII